MRHKQKEVKGKSRKVKVLGVATLVIFAFSLSTVTAQESVNATGGNASGGGGSVSYSVGQVVYTTNTGASGSVAQGVQQAYEIFTVGIKETELNIFLTVFPNPTTDYLTLSIDDFEISNLSYQLYDMNGKLLQNEKITGNQTSIVMSNLFPANYFLRVIHGNKEVKTFKIIKN